MPSPESVVWLRSKHRAIKCSEDHNLFISLVYQSPRSSTFQQHPDSLPSFEQLQHDVVEIAAHDGLVMLAGDSSAHTVKATDILSCSPDIAADSLDVTLQPAACMPVLPRHSADSNVCAFGRSWLSLSISSDLLLVNGRAQGDETGACTCHVSQGSSLVVSFIVSSSRMAAVSSLTVLDQRLESDHCPLKLMLNLQAAQSKRAGSLPEVAISEHQADVQKIRYRVDKVQQGPTGKPFVSFLNLS